MGTNGRAVGTEDRSIPTEGRSAPENAQDVRSDGRHRANGRHGWAHSRSLEAALGIMANVLRSGHVVKMLRGCRGHVESILHVANIHYCKEVLGM